MQAVRRAADRGRTTLPGLESRHTFSSGSYLDSVYMGFGPIRVLNEDIFSPGAGFAMQEHANMEIVLVMVSGVLKHEDSLGNETTLNAGDVQCLTTGSGLRYSEINPSGSGPAHTFQISVVPDCDDLQPAYSKASIPFQHRAGRLALLGSRDGRSGSVSVNRDVELYGSVLAPDEHLTHTLAETRGVWIQVVTGQVVVCGQQLSTGDALAITEEVDISIAAKCEAEILLLDVGL